MSGYGNVDLLHGYLLLVSVSIDHDLSMVTNAANWVGNDFVVRLRKGATPVSNFSSLSHIEHSQQ